MNITNIHNSMINILDSNELEIFCPYDCGEKMTIGYFLDDHLIECVNRPYECKFGCGKTDVSYNNRFQHISKCATTILNDFNDSDIQSAIIDKINSIDESILKLAIKNKILSISQDKINNKLYRTTSRLHNTLESYSYIMWIYITFMLIMSFMLNSLGYPINNISDIIFGLVVIIFIIMCFVMFGYEFDKLFGKSYFDIFKEKRNNPLRYIPDYF
jgi:hypothetical protein